MLPYYYYIMYYCASYLVDMGHYTRDYYYTTKYYPLFEK